MLNAKGYIEKGGNSCPFCGSTNIDGGGVEIEKGKAFQPCGCNQCEKEWVDIYHLVGFSHGDHGTEVIDDPRSRVSSLEEQVKLLREALEKLRDEVRTLPCAHYTPAIHDAAVAATRALNATEKT